MLSQDECRAIATTLGRTLRTGNADYEPPGCWFYQPAIPNMNERAYSVWWRSPARSAVACNGCTCSSSRQCILRNTAKFAVAASNAPPVLRQMSEADCRAIATSYGRTLHASRETYAPAGCWFYRGAYGSEGRNSVWYRNPNGATCHAQHGCACTSSRNCILKTAAKYAATPSPPTATHLPASPPHSPPPCELTLDNSPAGTRSPRRVPLHDCVVSAA
jgi:hypothetical protein